MDSFRCNAAAAVELVFEPVFYVAFELVFALVFEPVFDVAFALVFELVLQLYQYDVAHHLMNGQFEVQRWGTLPHSGVNPTGLSLRIFCLVHLIVTKT